METEMKIRTKTDAYYAGGKRRLREETVCPGVKPFVVLAGNLLRRPPRSIGSKPAPGGGVTVVCSSSLHSSF